jgi:pectate lyase
MEKMTTSLWSKGLLLGMLVVMMVCSPGVGQVEMIDISTADNPGPGEGIATAPSIPAFPEAEGFGAGSVGGRGGRVIQVTNLNDNGAGSLRTAVEAEGPRIVVFRVGGTIELQSPLNIRNPYITIVGQTAPGGGITLKNHPSNESPPLRIHTHDVIIRYIRSRPGPSTQKACCLDGIIMLYSGANNIIIDHCSVSWATDENVSTYGATHNISIQWCIIAEGLYNSTHEEGPHSMGILLAGDSSRDFSAHHNLLAHNSERNPRIAAGGLVDFVNNVVYNYGVTAGYFSNPDGDLPVNYVGNIVKVGADSQSAYEVELSRRESFTFSLYVSGNIGPHRPTDNLDESLVVSPEDRIWIVPTRHDAPTVTTTSAFTAYDQVLDSAGATIGLDGQGNSFWRRDAADERIVNDVRNGTGGIIDDPSQVGGWPELAAGTAPRDSDHDGMPDEWEDIWGFHPCNATDGPSDADGDGYTNVEEYLNGTDPGRGTVTLPGCFFLFLPIVVKSRPVPEDMSRGWQ